MWSFFALIIYMGLKKLPKISDYWSRSFLYRNELAPAVMSRNRLQELLWYIHFADNSQAGEEQLAKVKNLVSLLVRNFKRHQTPGEVVVIDKRMVPFRGRLIFKQYLPEKSSKYGVKLFKLCDTVGYTWVDYLWRKNCKQG